MPENTIDQRYFSIEEIAKYSGLSKYTIRRFIWNNGLPYHQINRKILIRLDEFDAWMDNSRARRDGDKLELDKVVDDVLKGFGL